MLPSFISGKTPSSMIIIEDGVDNVGSNLFQALIQSASARHLQVHIVCLENPTEKWNHMIKDNINVHDCFSDHRGWSNDLKNINLQQIYGEKGILGVVQELVHREGRPCVVCIDSLVPVLFRHGLNKCYRDLHTLLAWSKREEEKLNQLIAVVHEDAIPDSWNALAQLRHLATTVFQVHQRATSNASGLGLLRITHRKAGGKIIKQVEEYRVEKDFSVLSSEKKNQLVNLAGEVDPTLAVQNLTTFKLTLNPQEEEARSQLVLPYTRQNRPETQPGGGKVFYEPDAADDWDDEDPDDDLDV